MIARRMIVCLTVILVAAGVYAEDQKPAITAPASNEKPPPLEKKADAPVAGTDIKAPGKADEKAKSYEQIMREATAEARKNIKAGVEAALKLHPEVGADMRSQMSNPTQHERWIEQSRSAARKQAAIMDKTGGAKTWGDMFNKDVKGLTLSQKFEYDAVVSWTEQRAMSWLEESLAAEEPARKARIAAAEAAKKNGKKGGENTVPPNGNVIDGPLGPLTH